MSRRYPHLRKAGLTIDYLHTNSTTHAFIFGALAEIVDNSRDANANSLNIYSVKRPELRGGYMLCFLDDGEGMDPYECGEIMNLGSSSKKSTAGGKEYVGQYGNGLKSSTLRIANDFMLFTKKNSILSISFLSRTFFSDEGISKSDVLIAVPSFKANSKEPWFDINEEDDTIAAERHESEMKLILKFSPFKTKEDLFKQFDKIKGDSGTLVVIFNMLLNDNNKAYLQIDEEKKDIVLSNNDDSDIDELGYIPDEKKSFRKYVSILYSNPRMKIYIEGSKIRTKMFEQTLFLFRSYKFITKSFMAKTLKDIEKSEGELGSVKRRLEEAESDVIDFKSRHNTASNGDEKRILARKNTKISMLKDEFNKKKTELEYLRKTSKEEKHLNFKFGLNIQNRAQCGAFIYNQHRLIMMYKKMGKQLKNDPDYHGIVIMVDVPYSIMSPQHNKQSFSEEDEYQKLKKAISEYLDQYVRDIKYNLNVDKMSEFWKDYGYLYDDCDIPDNENSYAQRRFRRLPIVMQCDSCLKWRQIQANSAYIDQLDRLFPDTWNCSALHQSCAEPEKLPEPEKGELKKEEKRTPAPEPESIRYVNSVRQPLENDVTMKTNNQQKRLNPLELAKQNSLKLAEKKAAKLMTTSTSSSNNIKKLTNSISNTSISDTQSNSSASERRENSIVNRVFDEVDREDRQRRAKRPSEDNMIYDDEDDGNDGIYTSRFKNSSSIVAAPELKKNRRGPNMAELDTQTESEDPDYNPHRPTTSKKSISGTNSKGMNSNGVNGEQTTKRVEKTSTTIQLSIKREPQDAGVTELELWNSPEIQAFQLHDFRAFRLNTFEDVKEGLNQHACQIRRLLNSFSDPDSNIFNVCSNEFLLSFDYPSFLVYRSRQIFQKELDEKVREGVEKTLENLKKKNEQSKNPSFK